MTKADSADFCVISNCQSDGGNCFVQLASTKCY